MALALRSERVKRGHRAVLAHPFEMVTGTIFIISALNLLLVRIATPGVEYGLLALPTPLFALWAITIILGGVGVIVGCLAPLEDVLGRAVEKASLLLSATSWFTLGLTTFILEPAQWASWTQTFAVVVGCILRLRALRHVDRAVGRVAGRE